MPLILILTFWKHFLGLFNSDKFRIFWDFFLKLLSQINSQNDNIGSQLFCKPFCLLSIGSGWIVEDTQRSFGSCGGQQQTPELRRPGPQKYHLCHFGRLRQKGTCGALRSPRHPLPGPGCFPSGQLTNSIYFSLLFFKVIDLPRGKSMTSLRGGHYNLTFLLATPMSRSWTLEGLFELTLSLQGPSTLPCTLLPELERFKDAVRCVALGAEVPGPPPTTTDKIVSQQSLIV